MPSALPVPVGERFTRWIVLAGAPSQKGKSIWLCRCACGVEKEVESNALRSGHSKSCGCWRSERSRLSKLTHGYAGKEKHPLYNTWKGMRQRCLNPNHTEWKRYGEQGVKVCERWGEFPTFLADMGEKPAPGYSIDRIDPDGDYEPGNCRWATPYEQTHNRRKSK